MHSQQADGRLEMWNNVDVTKEYMSRGHGEYHLPSDLRIEYFK